VLRVPDPAIRLPRKFGLMTVHAARVHDDAGDWVEQRQIDHLREDHGSARDNNIAPACTCAVRAY